MKKTTVPPNPFSGPKSKNPGPSQRSILRAAVAPLALLLASATLPCAEGALVLSPGDAIVGGQLVNTSFTIGTVGTVVGNNWPATEPPQNAINGTQAKYLNRAGYGAGLMVTPLFDGGAGSVISSMQIWTANNTVERDPASYQIWGTNANLAPNAGPGTVFDTSAFTLVSSGDLALPAGRNLTTLDVANSQTVTFANTDSYKQYLVVFPLLKGPPTNRMQIAEVQFSGVKSSDVLRWTGETNGVWNVNGTTNWVTAGGVTSTYHDQTALTFTDKPDNRTITIQNGGVAVQPASMTFTHTTGTYTVAGDAIESAGTLSLIGAAEVILNNLANFSTGTVVNAGTLTVAAAGSLGSGSLTVNSQSPGGGATSTVTLNSPHSIGSLSGVVSATNASRLNLGGTLTVTQTNNADFQGLISGPGGLIKNGPATLNLIQPNSYAGPTEINAGILQSSRPNDEPYSALPAGQPVTVNAGGTLVLGETDGLGYYEGKVSGLTVNHSSVVALATTHHTLPAVTLNGGTLAAVDAGNFNAGSVINYILDGNVITVPDGGTSYIKTAVIRLRNKASELAEPTPVIFTVPRGGTAADLVVTAKIEDTGAGFTKNGNGVMALGNVSTATGPMNLQAGTLRLSNSNALGVGQVTLQSGSTLSLAPVASLTGFEDVSLNGGVTLNGNTSVTLTSGVGDQARSVFSNTPLPLHGGFTASWTYNATAGADGMAFVLQGVSPGVVGASGAGLGYQGMTNAAGLLFNIYQTSGTAFSTAGTTGGYTTTPFVLTGGNINVTVVYNPVAATLVETLVRGTTYTRTFTGVNLSTLFGTGPAFVGFSGATGGVSSTQTVSNFTFTAAPQPLTLANEIIVPAAATVGIEILPIKPGVSGAATFQGAFGLNNGAIVNVTGGEIATDTPYKLTVSGMTLMGAGVKLNVANNGSGVGEVSLGDITNAGANGSLTKGGPGTLTIRGAAAYDGATIVDGGTLSVQGSITGSTAINAGAILTGDGQLAGVTINGGGVLAPGDVIGEMKTGPLSLKHGSTLRVDLNALVTDVVTVNGAITLAGTINLAIALAADPAEDTTFLLLDGSAPLVGYSSGARFAYLGSPLAQGGQFEVAGNGFSQIFTIDYAAGGGRDITLTAIPEPTTTLSLLGALSALGVRRRRVA